MIANEPLISFKQTDETADLCNALSWCILCKWPIFAFTKMTTMISTFVFKHSSCRIFSKSAHKLKLSAIPKVSKHFVSSQSKPPTPSKGQWYEIQQLFRLAKPERWKLAGFNIFNHSSHSFLL